MSKFEIIGNSKLADGMRKAFDTLNNFRESQNLRIRYPIPSKETAELLNLKCKTCGETYSSISNDDDIKDSYCILCHTKCRIQGEKVIEWITEKGYE